MTITSCKRQPFGETASVSDGKETESQRYLVVVDTATATPLEVERATYTPAGGAPPGEVTMPAYGAAHSIDGALVVTGKTAKRAQGSDGTEAKFIWVVEVTYSIPQTNAGNGGPSGSTGGSGRNIRVSVSGVKEQTYSQLSRSSPPAAIKNSAGDMYPEPVPMDWYDEAITIEFDCDTLDMTAIAGVRGKINSGEVELSIPQGLLTFNRTFAVHTLKFDACSYDIVVDRADPAAHCWHVSITLLYRPDTWDLFLPQKGYRWDNGSGGKTDPADTCQYLAADGTLLGGGSAIVTTSAIQVCYEADLATLLEGI